MATPRHIIHRQLIDIKVADKAEAQRWQSEFSAYYKNVVLPALEKACDELCPGYDHIRISKLELDLGHVGQGKLRPEHTKDLVKQFREEILKVASEKLYLVKHGGAKTALPEGVAAMSARSGSLYDTVMYYLEHGMLPWWSPSEKFSIRRAVDELIAEQGGHFIESLRQLLVRKPFQQRVIDICTEKQLLQCFDPKGRYRLQKLFIEFKKIAKGKSQKHVFFGHVSEASSPAAAGTELLISKAEAVVSMLKEAGYQVDQIDFLQTVSSKAGAESELVQVAKEFLKDSKRRSDPSESGEVSEKTQDRLSNFSKKTGKRPTDLDVSDIRGFHDRKTGEAAEEKEMMKNTPRQERQRDERTPFPLHTEESVEIANAGAVLLWPYLQMFYKELGLVENASFTNDNAQRRAVQLLHYLVNGDEEAEEHDWVLFKLLCGLELTDFVPTTFEMTDREAEECDNLLRAVIRNWSVLKNTSPEGLQKSFLRRPGLLKRDHNGWIVHIERIAIDVLIDRLSWPISVVRLPWNKNVIHVRW